VAVLIGDVVRSRDATDRQRLHDGLLAAFAALPRWVTPLDPVRVTVGDEFQGVFGHVGAALDAAFRLRLLLLPEVDTRYGVAWGTVTRLDATTQDGPAWWAAREAIDWVKETAAHPATRRTRTAYRSAAPGAPDPGALNAALLCRDHLVGSWDDRSIRIMRGLMTEHTQAELAEAEGISASAVSQRVRAGGLATVLTSAGWLAELP